MFWTVSIREEKLSDRACPFRKSLQSILCMNIQESSNWRQFICIRFSAFSQDSSDQRHFHPFFCLEDTFMSLWNFYCVSPTLFSISLVIIHRYTHIHLLAPNKFLALQFPSIFTFFMFLVQKEIVTACYMYPE